MLKDLDVRIFEDVNNNKSNRYIYYKNGFKLIETNLTNIFSLLSRQESDYIFNLISSGMKRESLFEGETTINYIYSNYSSAYNVFKKRIISQIELVVGVTFYPQDKLLVSKSEGNYFNLYSKDNAFQDIQPNKDSIFPHFERLFKNIFQEGYDKFIQFLSWKVRYPHLVLPCNWVIVDQGGTGKSQILFEVLSRIMNSRLVTQQELDSSFNDYMKNSILLFFEEIESFNDEKKMKNITGSPNVTINNKYGMKVYIKNFNNVVITSNDTVRALRLSEGDRRFNVVGGGKPLTPIRNEGWETTLFGSKEENEKFFEEYHKYFEDEIKGLYAYLLSQEPSRLDLTQNLQTTMKQSLIESNFTSEGHFLKDLKDMGLDSMVEMQLPMGFDEFYRSRVMKLDESSVNAGNWIQISDLYKIYRKYCENSGLMALGAPTFSTKAYSNPIFNELFKEYKLISFHGKKLRCVRI